MAEKKLNPALDERLEDVTIKVRINFEKAQTMKTFLIALTTALAAMASQAATPVASQTSFSSVQATSMGIDKLIEAKKKGKKGHKKHKKS